MTVKASFEPTPAQAQDLPEVPLQRPMGPILRWVWRDYLRGRVLVIVAAILLMALEGSMLGFLSWMMQPMFDRVFVAADAGAIGWVAGVVAGIFALRAVAAVVQRAMMAQLGETVSRRMQTDLLAHLLRLDGRFFIAHPPGVLMERVRGDSGAVMGLLNAVLVPFVRDSVALASLFAVTILIDWRWTLLALIGTPLLVWPILLLQRAVRRTTHTARVAAANAAARLDEIFHGISTITLAGTADREAARFADTVDGQVRAQVTAATAGAAIPSAMDIVAGFGFAAVLSFGAAQIIEGDKTVGQFMAFFTAMALLFEPLRRLGAISAALQGTMVGLERVRALMDEPVRLCSPAVVTAHPSRDPGALAFEDVTFAYATAPAVENLSFRIEPGLRAALVGPSGAGKTTVFTLLTRLADPQSGRITLGGHDLRAFDLAALRGMFSVVSQETALFDETIRDNILMGRTDVAPATLEAALDAAHVTEFLPRLPHGLDTPAGPRGSGLSGGQRQRVAIARALLRDAPILLLDEATSALDAASEALVQSALDRLAQGRTTLVIAHRLSTVQGAQRILVMQGGQLVDEGTHGDLLARGGLYADLCRLQLG